MPLSSSACLNRIKISNTIGKLSTNTGQFAVVASKIKPKINLTFRNIYGNAPWADPYSFADYVSFIDKLNIFQANLIEANTPIAGLIALQAIIYFADPSEGILDAITGNVASGLIYLSASTFAHDIGNVQSNSTICLTQSLSSNTDVTLQNNNRIIRNAYE